MTRRLRQYIRNLILETEAHPRHRDIVKLAGSSYGITKKQWQKAIKRWYSNNADHKTMEELLVPMHSLTFRNFENFINGSITSKDELSTTPYLMDPTTGLPSKLSEGFLYAGQDMQLALSGRFTLCAKQDLHSGKGGKARDRIDDEESYRHVKQSSGINKYWDPFKYDNPWEDHQIRKRFSAEFKEKINYQLSQLIYDEKSIMDSRISWHQPAPSECLLDNWRIKAVIILEPEFLDDDEEQEEMPLHQRKWCEKNNIPIITYNKAGRYWTPEK